jgi:tryptophanyl-tRNA synthetase
LLKLFASPDEMTEIDRTYREGGKGYGHYKQQLAELFFAKFGTAREKRKALEKDLGYVESVLATGRDRARERARPVIEKVRRVTGVK